MEQCGVGCRWPAAFAPLPNWGCSEACDVETFVRFGVSRGSFGNSTTEGFEALDLQDRAAIEAFRLSLIAKEKLEGSDFWHRRSKPTARQWLRF